MIGKRSSLSLSLLGCSRETHDPGAAYDLGQLILSPNSRSIVLEHLPNEPVIVLASVYHQNDRVVWAGEGELTLLEAALACSGGLLIAERVGDANQIILPAAESSFGLAESNREFVECVREVSKEAFSASLHNDAVNLGAVLQGRQILPDSVKITD